jgi:hypothetical protein
MVYFGNCQYAFALAHQIFALFHDHSLTDGYYKLVTLLSCLSILTHLLTTGFFLSGFLGYIEKANSVWLLRSLLVNIMLAIYIDYRYTSSSDPVFYPNLPTMYLSVMRRRLLVFQIGSVTAQWMTSSAIYGMVILRLLRTRMRLSWQDTLACSLPFVPMARIGRCLFSGLVPQVLSMQEVPRGEGFIVADKKYYFALHLSLCFIPLLLLSFMSLYVELSHRSYELADTYNVLDWKAFQLEEPLKRQLYFIHTESVLPYTFKRDFQSLLSRFRGSFPARISDGYILPDIKQLTWTCRYCGKTLKDTVRELSPGAADKWAVSQALSQRGARNSSSVLMQLKLSITSWVKWSMLHLFKKSPTDPEDTLIQGVASTSNEDDICTTEKQYMLLNIRESRFTTRLVHNDISTCHTDEDLFRSLQKTYKKKKRWNWARIKILSHIEWKRFHLYHSDCVAINPNELEDWPRCARPGCASDCNEAIEYDYSPSPATLDPPIPRQAFMHFIHNPSHAGTKKFHYNIIPKRKHPLNLGSGECYKPGWGLEFKETVNWWLVAVVEGVIALALLGFAVVWRKNGGNVPDAFAPSCWMLAVGGIILTVLYHWE